MKNKILSTAAQQALLKILQQRFTQNLNRHKALNWQKVADKLAKHPEKLWSLQQMEQTGGEPDVVDFDKKTAEFIFVDCAAESPKERRSICYDREALQKRKANAPKNNAIDMAKEMGVEILSEAAYRALQKLGNFDSKTSSWLKTPQEIRRLGGAIFGDFRFDTVFIYHNGADSYYGSRGFRASLRV